MSELEHKVNASGRQVMHRLMAAGAGQPVEAEAPRPGNNGAPRQDQGQPLQGGLHPHKGMPPSNGHHDVVHQSRRVSSSGATIVRKHTADMVIVTSLQHAGFSL